MVVEVAVNGVVGVVVRVEDLVSGTLPLGFDHPTLGSVVPPFVDALAADQRPVVEVSVSALSKSLIRLRPNASLAVMSV
jgi:hypothetical protein